MTDNEAIRIIQSLICGYDPSTGKDIGQNGVQIDQNIQVALSRAMVALRRKHHVKVSELDNDDLGLNNDLKVYRKNKADELGIPAYRIAPDISLAEMALVKPRSIEKLSKICGLGPVRIRDFGKDFISIINSHLKSKGTDPEG